MGSRTLATYILIFLLTISVISTIGTVVYHMGDGKYKTEPAVEAVVPDEVSINAVFVRDEKIVRKNKNGVLVYKVDDAAKLGDGSTIADVYSSEDAAEKVKQAQKIDDKISLLESVKSPGTGASAMPSSIAEKIDESYKNVIRARAKKKISSIPDLSLDMIKSVDLYDMITGTSSDYDEKITELSAESSKLKSESGSPIETIKADESAYFIGYADGYENDLKTNKIGSMSEKAIDEVKDAAPLDDDTIVGKMVSGYKWYAVGIAETSSDKFTDGEKIEIRFSTTEKTAEGEIESFKKIGDGKYKIVVSSDDFESDFVQHRREEIRIVKNEYTGIKVSKKYLRFAESDVEISNENGSTETGTANVRGVYIMNGEEPEFRKLDIVYETDTYVVSAINGEDGYLQLYDSIITEGEGLNGN